MTVNILEPRKLGESDFVWKARVKAHADAVKQAEKELLAVRKKLDALSGRQDEAD